MTFSQILRQIWHFCRIFDIKEFKNIVSSDDKLSQYAGHKILKADCEIWVWFPLEVTLVFAENNVVVMQNCQPFLICEKINSSASEIIFGKQDCCEW